MHTNITNPCIYILLAKNSVKISSNLSILSKSLALAPTRRKGKLQLLPLSHPNPTLTSMQFLRIYQLAMSITLCTTQ